jgi:hypothetical protein
MSHDFEAVKARIRALLAKTVANGCTEGEALAAAEKAASMLRAHGLSETELHIGAARSASNRSRRQPLDDLWPAVAFACHCRLLLVRMVGCLEWQFTGHQPWPEVAVWLRGTLDAAHGRALTAFRTSPEYRRRRIARTRSLARRQFTAGFIEIVRLKLAELAALDRAAIRREMVAIDLSTESNRGAVRIMKPLSRASSARDTAADRAAGHAAGRQTQVNWSVRGDAPRMLGDGG